MSLQHELEETVSSIIEYQQRILLRKIAKEKNWDLETMISSSSQKNNNSNDVKRGRGRPTKQQKTNDSLDTNISYSDQNGNNLKDSRNDFESDYRIVDPNIFNS